MKIIKTILATTVLGVTYSAQANIVASVKPLGFIASSIADGVTDTQIIVPAGASPHDYNLKPSDVQKVKSADIVLWIGKDVDVFLEKSIHQIETKNVIELAKLEKVKALLGKSEHHHDDHDHDHDHDHGHHHEVDENGLTINWHIWYSPEISKVIANQVAEKLTEKFPSQKAKIAENLANFDRTLAAQNDKIKSQLAAYKDKGFYVFHDAYGYFNDAYGLKQTGAFTINPLVAPGAKTLAHIKEEIAEHKVTCLFAEPQFTPKVIETLSKGADVKVGRLDPMGDAISLGPNSYANFLQFTADSYAQCLRK
ncbi:MAG: zinc ABC transporter substrate-binding protein ZnuA [[Actinobacillus] rossii]|nr:zinc ABC transporter substrate-binding protein ZnuA [[Actinobacillus] rossii]MDD7568392.1 zinc ABC transporter substrate-binding protein ZnuA [[Actinobacillus] rossii]MDY3124397.1 zinc ABC transporter substrate-binding protein ZnuA [[Actinobacillus] rossii]MDY5793355.1 zinc ABC transporter substrate-binding protein ZnuA [[Actinobacillus] rossii]